MYYYMSLCNIPFLTSSLELLHGFASNFVLKFLRWTHTTFVRNDLFSSNYANELLGCSVTCIFTMQNYMSLCNIPLLTSLETLYGFASNFVLMFPTKFLKIGVLPLYFMELWVILYNFWPILKKSSSIKPLTRKHS